MNIVLIKALQLILSLTILVVLHEGGHFFFAKLFKVRVLKFYVFFNPKFHIFSTYDRWFRRLFRRKPEVVPEKVEKDENGNEQKVKEYVGTEYGLGWLPLGGYCAIAGMIDETNQSLSSEPQPYEFRTKPAWQRLLIMVGGVLVNLLLAFFIYSMIKFYYGDSYIRPQDMTYGLKFNEDGKNAGFQDGDIIIRTDDTDVKTFSMALMRDISNAETVTVLRGGKETVLNMPEGLSLLKMAEAEPPFVDYLLPFKVDSVISGTPAEKIGMKKGDVVTSFNGVPIASYNDFTYQILRLQDAVTEETTAADSLSLRTVQLVLNNTDTVSAVLTSEFKIGIINAMPDYKVTEQKYGFFESFPVGIKYGWNILGNYVNDLKYLFTKEGSRSVGGFVTMGKIFPDTWNWYSFWNLTAFFSIILAFMNILPIPALDGGHVLFLLYEIVVGRKPGDNFLKRAEMVGLFILLALLLYANGNDILRLFGI